MVQHGDGAFDRRTRSGLTRRALWRVCGFEKRGRTSVGAGVHDTPTYIHGIAAKGLAEMASDTAAWDLAGMARVYYYGR